MKYSEEELERRVGEVVLLEDALGRNIGCRSSKGKWGESFQRTGVQDIHPTSHPTIFLPGTFALPTIPTPENNRSVNWTH